MPPTQQLQLTSPIEEAPGVDRRHAPEFRRLGLSNVGRLIHGIPARYEFEAAESTTDALIEGRIGCVRGELTSSRLAGRPGRKRFEGVLIDDTGRLDIVWFNSAYLQRRLLPGMRLLLQGVVKAHGSGAQMINPTFEILGDDAEPPPLRQERWRPIYSASEALPTRLIDRAVQSCLDAALPLIEDHLPDKLRISRELPTLSDTYRMLHRPSDMDEVAAGRRRIAYDELLLLQLGVRLKRAHLRRVAKAPALRCSDAVDAHIRARLPFTLTPGQETAVAQIAEDLASEEPANRLIQGEVGSGKTLVALYAMLQAVASRHQSAIMAPTELLAEQHFATIAGLLTDTDVRVELLTGSLPDAAREKLLQALSRGEIDILIGTHALLTEHVRFQSLAVVVIDEQHRFGVHQRASLRHRSGASVCPHMLVMTATPIPRTLALTVFGDLDVSTIKGLPPGRSPVTTRLVSVEQSPSVYAHVRKRLDHGEQAYIVTPAIDTQGELRDVRSTLERLQSGALQGKRLAALHGQLPRDERERIMRSFREGAIDALVATTVIEVGVDVPNASIMVIEHAERFGMAQLHQLRGRVGRGSRRSLCVMIGEPVTPISRQRLEAVASTSDGFALAEKDLDLRGPGETIGARQSGMAPFRVAQFPRDFDLLLLARRDASDWIDRSPALSAPEEALVRSRLLKAHGEALGLADVA